MRTQKPGKINDNLFFLGRKESCVYFLRGSRESMLISGGMSYIVPDLLRQFEEFDIDETRITRLLILHSHFDHVGIIPFLQRRNRSMEISGSARAWEILHMPKAIKTINSFGRNVAERLGMEAAYKDYDLEWRGDISGSIVREGDRIDLGGIEGIIYETPGHSSCSITLYVPSIKTLFASDGAGIPFGNSILASGNSNFTKYQESLEKLRGLNTECVCADHFGYISGSEANTFIQKSIHTAEVYRRLLEDTYRRTGDINIAAKEINDDFYRLNKDYFLPPEIMEGVCRQMIRHVADCMNRGR